MTLSDLIKISELITKTALGADSMDYVKGKWHLKGRDKAKTIYGMWERDPSVDFTWTQKHLHGSKITRDERGSPTLTHEMEHDSKLSKEEAKKRHYVLLNEAESKGNEDWEKRHKGNKK